MSIYFCAVDVIAVAVLADAENTVLEGLLRRGFKQQRIDVRRRTVRQGLERAGLLVNHSFAREGLACVVLLGVSIQSGNGERVVLGIAFVFLLVSFFGRQLRGIRSIEVYVREVSVLVES